MRRWMTRDDGARYYRWMGALAAAFVVSWGAAGAPPLLRVRVATTSPAALEHRLEREGFDVLEGMATADTLDVIVTGGDLAVLRAQGLDVKIINRGRPLREIVTERAPAGGVPVDYLDYDAIVARMTTVASNFPNITQLVDLTTTYGMPTTFEGRHLYALKISDNPTVDEDEPAVLIVGAHHAREIVTPVIALKAIDELTQSYAFPGSPIIPIVDNTEIWIAPVWNPDGYQYVYDVDNLWRKNRRVFLKGVGVDQNRNYPFGWDSECSGSNEPSSLIFKGPEAGSEVETQTMMALSLDQHFAMVLDYHSSGREVLWGYACLAHPLDSWLLSEAAALSEASGYGGAERPPSADGEHYQWQLGAQSAHAFLIETATEFQPTYEEAQSEASLVWGGILSMLQRPIVVSGHVTDEGTGAPLMATIENLSLTFENGETNNSGGVHSRYHAFYPDGNYELRFTAEGYAPQTHEVSIIPGNPVQLDVALAPFDGADIDMNGVVNFTDLLIVLAAWGPCPDPPAECPADVNGNGQVDFADLLILLASWTV